MRLNKLIDRLVDLQEQGYGNCQVMVITVWTTDNQEHLTTADRIFLRTDPYHPKDDVITIEP